MTQNILQDWDFITWNELLADDVVLSLRMASLSINQIGEVTAVGGNLQVVGREDAKRLLKSIYRDIKYGLCVTSEILSGYDVALLGTMTLLSTKEGVSGKPWPVVIYMEFNSMGEIRIMTIAVADLKPLTDAIRSAAQTGILKAA